MNNQDKSELKQLMIEVIEIGIDGKFELIKIELAHIKEQTTRTNGRVTKNEDSIKVLEATDNRYDGIVRFVLIAGSALGGLALIILAIIELLLNK